MKLGTEAQLSREAIAAAARFLNQDVALVAVERVRLALEVALEHDGLTLIREHSPSSALAA